MSAVALSQLSPRLVALFSTVAPSILIRRHSRQLLLNFCRAACRFIFAPVSRQFVNFSSAVSPRTRDDIIPATDRNIFRRGRKTRSLTYKLSIGEIIHGYAAATV